MTTLKTIIPRNGLTDGTDNYALAQVYLGIEFILWGTRVERRKLLQLILLNMRPQSGPIFSM